MLPDNLRAGTQHVKFLSEGGVCEVLHEGPTQMHRLLTSHDHVVVQRTPQVHDPDHDRDCDRPHAEVVEVFSWDVQRAWEHAKQECSFFIENDTGAAVDDGQDDEVYGIRVSGPSDNRIDVVFMGDGYTSDERQKHMDDMEWLTQDMFEDVTFSSYLPLFNIHGVFRPSVESGVGTHGQPRDTAFRLFRQGTELRALYTANAPGARQACAKAPGCDFPSLIGNDDYYGGLGGQFVISTASRTSGPIVLRHEMGHNFAQVGDEYDHSPGYNGQNNANTLDAARQKWGVWLTEPDDFREEDLRMLVQDYAWYDLAEGPYTIMVHSQGYPRWLLRISVSGVETQDSFQVLLDGVPLPWTTPDSVDRFFSEYTQDTTGIVLTPGEHTLVFRQLKPPAPGANMRQLCSVAFHEYAAEPHFHQDDKTFIGAYATYGCRENKSFRPGNEHCLMRSVANDVFCSACQESVWHVFLQRMSLIDGVDVLSNHDSVDVQLHPVALAHFRQHPVDGEEYHLTWSRDGTHQAHLDDVYAWSANRTDASGSWLAQLEFRTPEVRQRLDLLTFAHSVHIET